MNYYLNLFLNNLYHDTNHDTVVAHFIPADKIYEVRPNFPAEMPGLSDDRDGIRRTMSQHSKTDELNLEINTSVAKYKRNKWLGL